MKSSSFSSFAVAAGLVVFNLVASALIFFVVMPLVFPARGGIPSAELSSLQKNIAVFCFVFGTLCSFVFVFGTMYLMRRDGSVQETLDAVRQPCLLLDENNRYVMLNREAEKVLGISRERDLGRAVESGVLGALSEAARGQGLDLRSVINRGGVSYQVMDNPLPVRDPSTQGRGRLVILRDVDAQVRIRDSFREITGTMAVLGDNTRGISESSHLLAQGATRQDSSLAAISSSLDEFSKKIQGSAESAAKGTQFAVQAREVAERSGGEIAHALSAMTDVQDAGVRIARIVKLIDDIAFQTNLLALNASVEAARAGRQGKGFAVVAEEVRNLAGRSARAAKDTASMVEDVTERIGNASAYISKLEDMLRNIVQEAIRIADYSAAAAATSSEQTTAILQVNQELGQMNSLTRNTRSAAERTSSSVESLARQVDELRGRIESFNADLGNAPAPAYSGYAPPREEDESRPADRKINLYDDAPFDYSYKSASSSRSRPGEGPYGYGETDASADDDFVAPFKKMAAAEDWDLHADANDGDNPLASLLRSDGYEKEYDDFLKAGMEETHRRQPGGERLSKGGGPMEYGTTKEGDRVVKPEQNIHLDDSEFGRY